MSELSDFLRKQVEGYLLEDLRSMLEVRPREGATSGAAGYPIVLTVFAGAELLGTLLFADATKPPTKTRQYFAAYWRGLIYPGSKERADAGDILYDLARNGLAHVYCTKGPFDVTKGPDGRRSHLTRSGDGRVSINCEVLVEDFLASYARFKAEAEKPSQARAMEERLKQLQATYLGHAEQASKDIRLPPGPAPSPPPTPPTKPQQAVPGIIPTFKSQT